MHGVDATSNRPGFLVEEREKWSLYTCYDKSSIGFWKIRRCLPKAILYGGFSLVNVNEALERRVESALESQVAVESTHESA